MIQIEIKGINKVKANLRKIQKQIKSEIPLKRINLKLQNAIKDNFNKGGNDEEKWVGLKGGTPAGKKILIDRGVLRGSFEGAIKGNELIFGTKVKYSKFHQQKYGNKTFSDTNKLPRRPMLPSTQFVGQVATKIYENYFNEILK